MYHYCSLSRSRSRAICDTISVTCNPVLDFLAPAISTSTAAATAAASISVSSRQPRRRQASTGTRRRRTCNATASFGIFEQAFLDAINQAASCSRHKRPLRLGSQQTRSLHSSPSQGTSAALRHQRFDRKGRLIIDTTGPRGSAYGATQPDGPSFIDLAERHFAETSTLPTSFFFDVKAIQNTRAADHKNTKKQSQKKRSQQDELPSPTIEEQVNLLRSVRELEDKLAHAKRSLADSMKKSKSLVQDSAAVPRNIALTKQDYLNLVDLYFYSYNSRFSPESSDASPTPIILEDYSFTLSSDFTAGTTSHPDIEQEDENYVSPLAQIEAQLKNNVLREIAAMQVFIDLLLDDESSNRALYEAYQELPKPGVAHLPRGVVRLFLQRMSVPWVKTQGSKLRYLSLIDEMQEAKLPITVSEWSAAIYLAGRSFSRIDQDEVRVAFSIWQKMEQEAGVKASNVTFNILFDVAVRQGKFALGETILTEMHKRNLRLNRQGRVSLIFYHGLRGDGDGVRKAYHDFVEAGEIVDTLVMNCVIASLINAGEPTAADQIYQRMQNIQKTLTKGYRDDGEEKLFKLHPSPGLDRIGSEMASNSLGRILERAPNLRSRFPEHHAALQNMMPLTPNFTTFRTMLVYHTSVSGDLDRITVLLKEMLEDYDIPLFPVVFQLLFKGFAIHGPQSGSGGSWSRSRLDMIWNSCRTAILDAHEINLAVKNKLPSIAHINSGMENLKAEAVNEPKARVLTMWEELVVDLATYPRERLKRLNRIASTHFEDDKPEFHSPYFQEQSGSYSAPQPVLDEEEGEYSLPDPVKSTLVDPNYEKHDPYNDDDLSFDVDDTSPEPDADWGEEPKPKTLDVTPRDASFSEFERFTSNPRGKYRLVPTKPLVCWLLRAYSRNTRSRAQVEEVWSTVRKIWTPKDDVEAQHVLRVLMRCLRDCDRLSGHG